VKKEEPVKVTRLTITASFEVTDREAASDISAYLFEMIVDTVQYSNHEIFDPIIGWDTSAMVHHTEDCVLDRDAGEPGSAGLGCDCGAEELTREVSFGKTKKKDGHARRR